ncbi:non-homologous end-joining DNA ligase [Actinocrinis puniceicyclus]|uniref:Non-homologous end-joining DNA ligase n=1 Tax=Actinocrinis puniceicyclus TaxID=977794 RepID=A0A8J7WV82_9ACTN|nr:non-homologous end-joining DNA ligase [Actinocrinis puniceicyclus]MBS2966734.1 non-homologous end-joining DNA ligase [Actinocrinis puniceicyclus]
MSGRGPVQIDADERRVRLSNQDKVLFPRTGFTKGDLVDYYRRIAPVLLPHLAGRPVTLKRFPDGTGEAGFFSKNAPPNTPSWLRTVTLAAPHSTKGRDSVRYLMLEEPAALVWAANLAGVELHVPPWRVGPRGGMRGVDRLVFDLDPGPPAGLGECVRVALLLRDALAADGLSAYPGVSGGKGMHLYVPIREAEPARAARYARRVASALEEQHPDLAVTRMAKAERPGKVFIDWSQNSGPKTTVAPYSLRAEECPAVALALRWEEVERGDPAALVFEPAAVLRRIERDGDAAAAVLSGGPALPSG